MSKVKNGKQPRKTKPEAQLTYEEYLQEFSPKASVSPNHFLQTGDAVAIGTSIAKQLLDSKTH